MGQHGLMHAGFLPERPGLSEHLNVFNKNRPLALFDKAHDACKKVS
jgi:hypothetical protein